MITAESQSGTSSYNFYAKEQIYGGNDGNKIGIQASASFTSSLWWNSKGKGSLRFGDGGIVVGGKTYENFRGGFQEIRLYNLILNTSSFDDYVMNPLSIEGNTITGSASSKNSLIFRAPLGTDLDTSGSENITKTSIHPAITGSFPTSSFSDGSSTYFVSGSFTYRNNRPIAYYDQINSGIKDVISNKIQITNNLTASGGDVLSQYSSIQQNFPISESYTKDIDYVEVAFSPQNEINDDIISQIGYFNIGEYIGDPRQISSSATSYPDLDTLRDAYFEKYTHNYGIWDYVRLIKYLDNSLFKMIKDWVPARTSLASGVVIKQHLLERNKYPTPQVSQSQENNYTGSISIGSITGSNGGSMPDLQGNVSGAFAGFNISPITQSWAGTIDTLSGSVAYTHSTQDEFFNGELSGSILTVTTQSLNPGCDIFLTANTVFVSYSSSLFVHSLSPEFLDSNVIPPSGELYLLYDSGSAL